jgi:surfeit locus 1 family protein
VTPWRRLIGPGVATACMMVILVGLGVWQLHRLVWKQGILAQIDQAEASPAVPLPPHPSLFQKVAIAGVLRPGPVILYGADVRDTPQGPQMGGQLIEPLIRPDGPPVLVDLGWVPDHGTGRADVPAAQGGPARVEGYIRLPEHPGAFSPKDDPSIHRFYTLNPQAMATALGLPDVAPFTLIAMGPAPDNVYPSPATALPRPPNDHFGYALTWFGLALTLAGVFGAWARGVLRAGNGTTHAGN